jgi:PPM family protein phosphatase
MSGRQFVQIVAKTDVGLVRKRNEDYFVVAGAHDLVALCDGMGGHPGGDVASRMVAEEIERVVTQGGEENIDIQCTEGGEEVRPFALLLHGVFLADRKLRDYGHRNPELQGMGTTLVAIQERNGVVGVVHVGDSRVYSFRAGSLTQVTQDHSVVAAHPEYAHLAGMRNILTRAMGVGDELEVDFTIVPVQKEELFLLCTDGLHNYVTEQRIVEVLASGKSAEERADTLIEDAKKGGGGDNVTLSLARMTRESPRKARPVHGLVTGSDSGLKVEWAA